MPQQQINFNSEVILCLIVK